MSNPYEEKKQNETDALSELLTSEEGRQEPEIEIQVERASELSREQDQFEFHGANKKLLLGPNSSLAQIEAPRFGTHGADGTQMLDAYDDDDSESDLSEELFRDFECFSDSEEEDVPAGASVRNRHGSKFTQRRDLDASINSELPLELSSQFQSKKTKATSTRTREKIAKADKPALGIFYFILYTFLKTLSYVVVQMLYNREKNLKPFPMLFIRSAFGIAIMVIQLNLSLKKDTWDCVTRDQAGSLAFKTFTGTTTNIINYSVTKYIPLTIISIVSNLAPIIVVVLAYLILKETIRGYDLLMMLLTLVGIFAVILGGDSENQNNDADPALPFIVLYILLLINPFLSAGGTIAMRKMKKFGDAVVSWYLQWAVLISSAIIMGATNLPFTIYNEFDVWSWLLAAAAGVTSVYSETMRFKALKLQKASAVQKLIPLTTLFQFVFDVTLFSVKYDLVQYLALGYLLLLYVFQGLKYALYDSKKKKRKIEERMIRKQSISAAVQEGAQTLDEKQSLLIQPNERDTLVQNATQAKKVPRAQSMQV